jgi:hypothetical protein
MTELKGGSPPLTGATDSAKSIISEELQLCIRFPKVEMELDKLQEAVAGLPGIPKDWVVTSLRDKTCNLWIPDYGGEIHTNPDYGVQRTKLLGLYQDNVFGGFLLIIDPTFSGFAEAQRRQHILGISTSYQTYLERFLEDLTFLRQGKRAGRLNTYCAVVLTKTDEPRFRDFRKHPRLLAELVLGTRKLKTLTARFLDPARNLAFFCCSAVGSTASGANVRWDPAINKYIVREKPHRPTGVLDPFVWLMERRLMHREIAGQPLPTDLVPARGFFGQISRN